MVVGIALFCLSMHISGNGVVWPFALIIHQFHYAVLRPSKNVATVQHLDLLAPRRDITTSVRCLQGFILMLQLAALLFSSL